jgi:hypothetical protein
MVWKVFLLFNGQQDEQCLIENIGLCRELSDGDEDEDNFEFNFNAIRYNVNAKLSTASY